MTLAEMSCLYRDSADAIRLRMAELRLAVRQETDPEAVRRLRRRITELTPLPAGSTGAGGPHRPLL